MSISDTEFHHYGARLRTGNRLQEGADRAAISGTGRLTMTSVRDMAWLDRHVRFWKARLDALADLIEHKPSGVAARPKKKETNLMTIKNALAGVAVKDLDKAIAGTAP